MKRLRNDKVTDTTGEQPIMPDDELTGPPGNPQDAERYDTGMVSDQGDADMRPVPYELEPSTTTACPTRSSASRTRRRMTTWS